MWAAEIEKVALQVFETEKGAYLWAALMRKKGHPAAVVWELWFRP